MIWARFLNSRISRFPALWTSIPSNRIRPDVAGYSPQHRPAQSCFSASRFSHDAHGLIAENIKGHMIHGLQLFLGAESEIFTQILDPYQYLLFLPLYGSSLPQPFRLRSVRMHQPAAGAVAFDSAAMTGCIRRQIPIQYSHLGAKGTCLGRRDEIRRRSL